VASLFSDLSVLCAPGSRVCTDFLDSNTLRRTGGDFDDFEGFPTLAQTLANKGTPFLSGLKPTLPGEFASALVDVHRLEFAHLQLVFRVLSGSMHGKV
jgi:hypothetical protein